MKPLFSCLAITLLVLVLGSAGCTNQSSQPPSPEPISDTVQKMAERMNAGDLEGSLAYFADALTKFKPAFAKVMPPEDDAAPSTEQPMPEMAVTIAGGTCTIDHPAPLQAGEIKVTSNIKDQNKELYALTIFNLYEEKDILDLMASTAGMQPPWAGMLLFEELEPGKIGTYTFTVEKGLVYLICWSKYPELPIGNAGPIEVIQ